MDASHSEIAIIGAGMAGLACARAITAAGRKVQVFDKGRGPGGRMAARRVEIGGESVRFDHGAQYFTARDPDFRDAVAAWEAQGAVARWNAASRSDEDPAFVGTPGMNGPIKAMAESVGGVVWNTRIEHLAREGEHWHLSAGEASFIANTVLVAVPAEQARDLLQEAAPDLAAIAARVISEPCWAVMAAFEAPLPLEADALRDPAARISWAARNSSKPHRTGAETWVLHASPKRSREVIDLPKDDVAELLLADFFAQAGIDPVEPVHIAAHRWLYAQPASLKGEPARYDEAAQIGIAGDYLHSPRVEGAWLSGAALAKLFLG